MCWIMFRKLKTTVISKKSSDSLAFYIERIDLSSKLRELNQKWRWSQPFSDKKSPH